MARRRKRNKPTLSKEDQAKKDLNEKIRSVFSNAGFQRVKTDGVHFSIGNREDLELDGVYVYQNIIIIVEETVSVKRDHIRTKKESAEEILSNKEGFLDLLASQFGLEKDKYDAGRWRIFYLYFCSEEIFLSEADKELFQPLIFVKPAALDYFLGVSKVIKRSFVYEVFRFLDLKKEDVGELGSPSTQQPPMPIVYPKQISGTPSEVTLVSFVISAETLIRNGYVLRKDSWEEHAGLYQRLVIPSKINSIRRFIADQKRTFFNNIIVSLPRGTTIRNEEGKIVKSCELSNFNNCTLSLPDQYNSICIIDGQHRIYGYYEDNKDDETERTISTLRKRLHLLVTGIIFPEDWSLEERTQFESSLFLEINQNSKNVSKDITIHILAAKEPYAKTSLARQILINLNQQGPFENRFQISLLEEGKIKTSSIIQYALAGLVEANVAANGFYKCWRSKAENGNAPDVLSPETDPGGSWKSAYVNFCSNALNIYFGAVRSRYKEQWENAESKITKSLALNALIIAFRLSLEKTGEVKDFEFYQQAFGKKRIDFENPNYGGSQYSKFAREVIVKLFEEDADENE